VNLTNKNISKTLIQIVLSTTYNLKLHNSVVKRTPYAVRLIINKFDLFRRLCETTPSQEVGSPQEAALKLYADLKNEITMACTKNDIRDFSCRLSSAATGENTELVVREILDKYFFVKE
jgi:hypothetical protein